MVNILHKPTPVGDTTTCDKKNHIAAVCWVIRRRDAPKLTRQVPRYALSLDSTLQRRRCELDILAKLLEASGVLYVHPGTCNKAIGDLYNSHVSSRSIHQ